MTKKQIIVGHISQLGISPALFEAMVSNAESNPEKIKLNKRLIRKEIKAKKRKNLIKGLR